MVFRLGPTDCHSQRHDSRDCRLDELAFNYNASWCYYVFFGGTNWGYNTGCNEFLPLQTTYDYNAPIDEAGRITPKYRALRELLANAPTARCPSRRRSAGHRVPDD